MAVLVLASSSEDLQNCSVSKPQHELVSLDGQPSDPLLDKFTQIDRSQILGIVRLVCVPCALQITVLKRALERYLPSV